MSIPSTVDDLEAAFVAQGYVPERSLSIAIHLAVQMGKPLFVEGEPGVGKTEIAKVLASISAGELIRLQCYEGLDASHALYEWDYARQMLAILTTPVCNPYAHIADCNVVSQSLRFARKLSEVILWRVFNVAIRCGCVALPCPES